MAKKFKGVGDVIANITQAVGIDECVGCQSRKDWLNVNFPFNKPRPLTAEEKEKLSNNPTNNNLIEIYNSAFNQELTSNQENVINSVKTKLNKLLEYEN